MDHYTKAVIAVIKAAGCFFVRHGKGDHDVWYSPVNRKTFVVDGKIKSRHSANDTLKAAGLPRKL